MSETLKFGKWTIDYDPPPIPVSNYDWHYTHEDDDGAPDGSSARSGHAASLQDRLDAICELQDDAIATLEADNAKLRKMGHDEALDLICHTGVTLSYQEAIEGYLKLRGIEQ